MTGERHEEQQSDDVGPEITYELKSVKEAAELLRVSESTVWRYADQDLLPSYRVGHRRVMFRRSDLESLLNRVRRKKTVAAENKLRLFAMSEAARGAVDVVERSRALRNSILARRGGVPVSESWEDINLAREERTADL